MTKKELQKAMTELEGREIFIIDGQGEKRVGVISGSDYYIGLTIQDKYTKDYLLCCNGEYSPHTDKSYRWDEDVTNRVLSILIKHLNRGIFEVFVVNYEVSQIASNCGGSASAETCPFN